MVKNYEQIFNDGIRLIKPFPHIIQDAINLIDSGDSDNHKLENIIKQDPIIAARILSLANSPFYGMSREVGNIENACIILGNHIIRNILVSAGALGCFPLTEQRKNIWLHSIKVASISELLEEKFHLDQSNAYIAGLLHDVGKFLLMDLFPEYEDLIEKERTYNSKIFVDEETKIFGFSHAQASAKIIKSWNLPEALQCMVKMHKIRDKESDELNCTLLYLAHEICLKLEIEAEVEDGELLLSLNPDNISLLNIDPQELKDFFPELKSKVSYLSSVLEELG